MNERLQGSNSDRSFLGDYFDVVAAAHELKSPVALIRQLALNLIIYINTRKRGTKIAQSNPNFISIMR